MMKSQIKQKLESMNEDQVEVSNIKPLNVPKKPNKSDFNVINSSNGTTDINEGRDSRLKVINMIRGSRKMMSKEEINNLAHVNLENEPLNKNIYGGNVFIQGENCLKPSDNSNNRSNLSLINQFEEFYKEQFKQKHPEQEDHSTYQKTNNINLDYTYEANLSYTFGINTSKKLPSLCFHKKEKWVASLNKNLIIIENFNSENEENLNSSRSQHILSDSKMNLDVIKLSENGKILTAYSQSPGHIYFYSCYPEDNTKFKLINKTIIKHTKLLECEISPQNNICMLISANKEEESYISALDFTNNEILMTTVLTVGYTSIKWNPYLTNLEFTTLSPNLYTFWRINSNDVSLQYQHGDFEMEEVNNTKNIIFTAMEYTPPLGVNCVILLLLSLSNFEIWGVDTKTNSIHTKYSPLKEVNNLNSSHHVSSIICSLKYISFISGNTIKYFKLPYLKEIKHDDLNLFTSEMEELMLDSEILSLDLDQMTSEGICLTKKSTIFCITYQEKAAVRLASYIEEKNEILSTKVINRDYQFYSLRKIDYDNLELEQISPNVKDNQYLLVTAHKGGSLKIWSIPEYELVINFDTMTEEVICFDNTPNDLKIVCSYSSGFLRFFDLNKNTNTFLGKYKSISGQPYKFIKFLPDGQFLFAVDMNNTVFLIKIERYEPLLVQIHQLFNISGNILDFQIHPVENYNRFLVNIQNVYLQVYNRKFTNVLKNLSYDSSIPVFYMQDKFHIDEYLRNSTEIDKADVHLHEYFHFEFSQNSIEKGLVYILSEARKVLLVRNFELHTINKIIKLESSATNFSITPNSAYIVFLFHNYFKLNQIGTNLPGLNIKLLSKVKNLSVSLNGKILIFHSDHSIFFYTIKYN